MEQDVQKGSQLCRGKDIPGLKSSWTIFAIESLKKKNVSGDRDLEGTGSWFEGNVILFF